MDRVGQAIRRIGDNTVSTLYLITPPAAGYVAGQFGKWAGYGLAGYAIMKDQQNFLQGAGDLSQYVLPIAGAVAGVGLWYNHLMGRIARDREEARVAAAARARSE